MTEMHKNLLPPMPQPEQEGEGHVLPPPRCAVAPRGVVVEETHLHGAAAEGNVKKVRAWLDLGEDINAQNQFGNTALHIAARDGKVEVVRFLRAQEGIDETIVNSFGQTPQDCSTDAAVASAFAEPRRATAAIRPMTKPPEEKLLDGLLADTKKDGKIIPSFPAFVVFLLSFVAALVCGIGAVACLAQGAGMLSVLGWLAGGIGAAGSMFAAVAISGAVSMRLEERQKTIAREGQLMWAVKQNNTHDVKSLLASGLNPSGYPGNIPLHSAVKWGNVEVVRDLIAYGADPNAKDEEGYTPVFRAIMGKKAGVVAALLDSPDTSLDIPNNSGLCARNFLHLVAEPEAPESSPEKEAEPPRKGSSRPSRRRTEHPTPAPK